MPDPEGVLRDLTCFVLPEIGVLEETGNSYAPYRLLDPAGAVVPAVAVWFSELQAQARAASTLRSYGMDLLRWYRFLWAVEVSWERASRVDGRDFARWMQGADKPVRVHWRQQAKGITELPSPQSGATVAAGTANPVTGKATVGLKYAASTRAHAETVLRSFYDFHAEEGTGPLLNPFPLDRRRRGGRAHAHHRPGQLFAPERQGRYRPRVARRVPRRIPDALFDAVFAALRYDRDRALLSSWVSTGARASELLSSGQQDADPGQQLITVVRKGTREEQAFAGGAGHVCVVAAISGGGVACGCAEGREPGLVVDTAQTVAAVDLSRGAGDADARSGVAGLELDLARSAAHGGVPDGT